MPKLAALLTGFALLIAACSNKPATTTPAATTPTGAGALSAFCSNMKTFDDTIGAFEQQATQKQSVDQAVTISQAIATSAPDEQKSNAGKLAAGWKAIQAAAERAGYDKSRIEASESAAWDSSDYNTAVSQLVTFANANCGTSLRITGTTGGSSTSPAPAGGGSGSGSGGGSGGGSGDGGGGSGGGSGGSGSGSGGGSGGGGGGSGGGSGGNGGGCGHGGWDGYGGGGCS